MRTRGTQASGRPKRIAVTGTPGAGKTTLCARAADAFGWQVVDLRAWAKAEGAIVGHDAADQADVIDMDALAAHRSLQARPAVTTLYDGHLAHLLPLDAAWVVRCDPDVLRPRLVARGYPAAKVRENLEAEALDIILQECLDRFERLVVRDGTRRSPDELLQAFVDPGMGTDIEAVDWSDRLPV